MANMKVTSDLSLIPLILGKPFLVTAKATTNWEKGVVELKVGEEKVELNISRLMKYPSSSHEEVSDM